MGFFRWMPCPTCCQASATSKGIGYEQGIWLDHLYLMPGMLQYAYFPLLADDISKIWNCWIAFFPMLDCWDRSTDPPGPYKMALAQGDWDVVKKYVEAGGVVWVSGEWNGENQYAETEADVCMRDATRDQLNEFISSIGGSIKLGQTRAACGGLVSEEARTNYELNTLRVMNGVCVIPLGWSGSVEGGTWLMRYTSPPEELANPLNGCPEGGITAIAMEKVDKGYVVVSCDTNLDYLGNFANLSGDCPNLDEIGGAGIGAVRLIANIIEGIARGENLLDPM